MTHEKVKTHGIRGNKDEADYGAEKYNNKFGLME